MLITHGASNASKNKVPLLVHCSLINHRRTGPNVRLSPQKKVINLSLPKSNLLLIGGTDNQVLDTLLINMCLSFLI